MAKQNESSKKISLLAVGRTLIVTVDGKKLDPLTIVEKEERDKIKLMVESYKKTPSENKLAKILKMFSKKKEAKLLADKAKKKQKKHAVKKLKQDIEEVKKDIVGEERLISDVSHEANEVLGDKRFVVKNGEMFLAPYLQVPMPVDLVAEIKNYLNAKQPVEPLINFWMLALLNPNPIARTKLFAYLSRHKLLVTQNGYIVTYRMVKTTDKKTEDGRPIYTSAHTGKEEYVMGTAFKLDRAECDEDGNRDCSKGLHTGTPVFMGIQGLEHLGEGYKKVNSASGYAGGYGTGYDRPEVSTKQTFSQSFGNQGVICLVNPMHVVSVPESDTRKLRACELFFCSTTTAEEVIKLQDINDYKIFDHQYKEFEEDQLKQMLAATPLSNYTDKKAAKDAKVKMENKKKELEEKQAQLRLNLNYGGDSVNQTLSLVDINKIIQSRISVKK
jgi:hypothetical protein